MACRAALALAALCLLAGSAAAVTVLDCAKLPTNFGQVCSRRAAACEACCVQRSINMGCNMLS